jgi:hypothetical protein
VTAAGLVSLLSGSSVGEDLEVLAEVHPDLYKFFQSNSRKITSKYVTKAIFFLSGSIARNECLL